MAILFDVMGRGRIVVGLVAAVLWCAPSVAPTADADDRPLISADRIGPQDDDEPARDSDDDHYLSPAERDALAAQGYELQIDDTIVTQTRIQPSQKETQPAEKKGSFGRAMDSVGKGMVAVASVALPLAAAVAPFFLF